MELEEWEPGYKAVRFSPYIERFESCYAPRPVRYVPGTVIEPRVTADGGLEGPLALFGTFERAQEFAFAGGLRVLPCAYVRSSRKRELFQFYFDDGRKWFLVDPLPEGTICAEKVWVFFEDVTARN